MTNNYLDIFKSKIEELMNASDEGSEHTAAGYDEGWYNGEGNAYYECLRLLAGEDFSEARKAIERRVPKTVDCEGDDESDWVHCPCCGVIIGSNEGTYNDFGVRNWKPIYCQECGQAMIWHEKI